MQRGEPEPGTVWTAGQVARHLKIAESTLRAWHRRYGVGPDNPQPGRYRRYTADDVIRLRRMRDLIDTGMLPSEAARSIDTEARHGGSPGEDLAETLAAARALDSARCLRLVEQALRRQGVVETWERLCRPALVTIDADQRDDPDCVDTEHALSWAISAALHRVPHPVGAPVVLLACTSTEQHCLALEALAAALAERGRPARMLGAATPTQSLARAVESSRPADVVLWSQRPDTAHLDAIRSLRHHPVRRITAGPGWPSRRPSGTEHVASLNEALTALTR
ncbi:MerR family transcriptional regulator [Amycolatopsis sp. K13G38]|uniref:MerR family transcriptional regulator n=1 Tax=Amycolatopsis acididurans TaxID=2724524 RepID=A0ABX1IX44_9PSEU|nr:MerR family transcriptional regulator [Amycolatopsis acididurans]NKQ52033.1 MerR family transcriptional regulator [Amycolatopsis acididurans]